MGKLAWLFAALIIFALTGCGQDEILSDLNARESIEIVGVLRSSGVVASRKRIERGRESRYGILVAESDKQRALHALYKFGYPRSRRPAPEDLTKQQGFVPNPPEVNEVRLDRLLAVELERLVEALPGVVEARALVRSNLNTDTLFSKKFEISSASILVTYAEQTGRARFSDDEIKALVKKSIPGIKDKDIIVRITRLDVGVDGVIGGGEDVGGLSPVSPFGFSVPASQRGLAFKQIVATLIVIGACALVIGVYGGWFAAKRKVHPARRSKAISGGGDFFIEETKGKTPPSIQGPS